jgi:hypothetical protein
MFAERAGGGKVVDEGLSRSSLLPLAGEGGA